MSQRYIIISIVVAILVIFAIIFLIATRLQGNTSQNPNTPPEQEVPKTVSAADVISDPLVYDDFNVIIEGEISDWVTERSFTLSAGGGGLLGGYTRQLLIITEEPFSLPQDAKPEDIRLGEITQVRVEGRVEIMNREELQEKLGVNLDEEEISLDDNTINRWELGPVVLPTAIGKL